MILIMDIFVAWLHYVDEVHSYLNNVAIVFVNLLRTKYSLYCSSVLKFRTQYSLCCSSVLKFVNGGVKINLDKLVAFDNDYRYWTFAWYGCITLTGCFPNCILRGLLGAFGNDVDGISGCTGLLHAPQLNPIG